MDSMDWQRRAVMAEVERDLARAECARLQAELTTARALVSLEIAEKYGVEVVVCGGGGPGIECKTVGTTLTGLTLVERCAEQILKTQIRETKEVEG